MQVLCFCCYFFLCHSLSLFLFLSLFSLAFRHEMPTDPNDPLADQNIKDRYYGVNDPVAAKLLKQASSLPALEPPSDRSITTLYVGGLEGKVTEQDLRYEFPTLSFPLFHLGYNRVMSVNESVFRCVVTWKTYLEGKFLNPTLFFSPHCRDYFYQFGELRSISMVPRQNCAFVCFASRASAETAAERSFNKLLLKGRRLKIMWGKSQGQQSTPGKQGGIPLMPVPGLPGGWFGSFACHQQQGPLLLFLALTLFSLLFSSSPTAN